MDIVFEIKIQTRYIKQVSFEYKKEVKRGRKIKL